ncbi:hypothetical protein AJ78_05640, partial [Emergomyces pasteurianus Ep9510]
MSSMSKQERKRGVHAAAYLAAYSSISDPSTTTATSSTTSTPEPTTTAATAATAAAAAAAAASSSSSSSSSASSSSTTTYLGPPDLSSVSSSTAVEPPPSSAAAGFYNNPSLDLPSPPPFGLRDINPHQPRLTPERDGSLEASLAKDKPLEPSLHDRVVGGGLLRESVFPDWRDGTHGGGYQDTDEMQKQDPLATQIWKLYSRTKSQLPNQERMENLTWRMMAMNLRKKREREEANLSEKTDNLNEPKVV